MWCNSSSICSQPGTPDAGAGSAGNPELVLSEKPELLEDIKAFLNPQTRRWYSMKGLLYKRGYLLYGPPGTGKSSLILSIAGYFGLDIYKLDISRVNENSLSGLFDELPRNVSFSWKILTLSIWCGLSTPINKRRQTRTRKRGSRCLRFSMPSMVWHLKRVEC